MKTESARELSKLNRKIIACRNCPRLVEWRVQVAHHKTKRYLDWEYWGKAVPGFGDPQAGLWIIGLAPAAHGANRTGRMFTGDRSGNWLYRALFKAGFANQATSISRDDGLKLFNCYISALARCVPPGNKPTREEFANCQPYLEKEFDILQNLKVILCLGQLAYQHTLYLLEARGFSLPRPRLKFRHGLEFMVGNSLHLITSYHPSQQNTFTGKLTEEMLDGVFERIRGVL